jgi:hypothetical protein
MKARWFNNHVCKTKEKLLERLDHAILEVMDKPEKTNIPPLSERYSDKRSKPLLLNLEYL